MSTEQKQPPLPPAVTDLFRRFVALMREGNIEEARKLAPGVEIQTEGWPYPDETGPLNPAAFQGDPRLHELMVSSDEGNGAYQLRSGAAWYKVGRAGGEYRIVDGGLKPIE